MSEPKISRLNKKSFHFEKSFSMVLWGNIYVEFIRNCVARGHVDRFSPSCIGRDRQAESERVKIDDRSDVEVFWNCEQEAGANSIEKLISDGALDTIFEDFIPSIATLRQFVAILSQFFENIALKVARLSGSMKNVILDQSHSLLTTSFADFTKREIHTLGLITASGIFKV